MLEICNLDLDFKFSSSIEIQVARLHNLGAQNCSLLIPDHKPGVNESGVVKINGVLG